MIWPLKQIKRSYFLQIYDGIEGKRNYRRSKVYVRERERERDRETEREREREFSPIFFIKLGCLHFQSLITWKKIMNVYFC